MSITFDQTGPTPAISTNLTELVLQAPNSFTVDFGEAVSGFELGDVTVSNGIVSNLQTSDNQTFTKALAAIRAAYDLIITENEAGLEHLSRYRLNQVDLFLIVLTPGRSSWAVADRIRHTAEVMDMEIGESWLVYNRTKSQGVSLASRRTLLLPECDTIAALDRQGGPLLAVADDHPLRAALGPIIERICRCV